MPRQPARHPCANDRRRRGGQCLRPGLGHARDRGSADRLGFSEPGDPGEWEATWARASRMGRTTSKCFACTGARRDSHARGGRRVAEERRSRRCHHDRLGRGQGHEPDRQPAPGDGGAYWREHGLHGACCSGSDRQCRRNALVGSRGTIGRTGGGSARVAHLCRGSHPQSAGCCARRMDVGVGS